MGFYLVMGGWCVLSDRGRLSGSWGQSSGTLEYVVRQSVKSMRLCIFPLNLPRV
jgi:hypothetical protein